MKTFADFNIDVPDRGGAERYTTCPNCSDGRKRGNKRAKCLSVNVDKEVWLCHHCGWKGSLKKGAEKNNGPLHWQKPEYTVPTWEPPPQNVPLDDKALAWFAERGITPEVIARNKIAYGAKYMPQDEDWVNCIQYPFFRKGEVVNVKYRDGHKHFRMEAGAERIFYGLDDISPTMTVIVEGEMDKLALETAGIPYCISVPDGAPAPDASNYASKFDFMANCEKELEPVELFVIAVDNDPPGQKLQEELCHRLGRHRCHLATWPDGCKDANDTLLKHGPDAVMSAIYDAEPYPITGVISVRDVAPQLRRLYERGLEPGISTGWHNVDSYYRVATRQWTLVTGIPGHGKSEWLDGLAVNLATLHDWRFAVYSPENTPLELHIAKLVEKRVGKQFAGDSLIKMSEAEMEEAATWVDQHFFFVNPDEDNFTLDAVLEMTESLVMREGIKGLIIDPWNEVEHERPGHLTETEYISKCLSRLKNFARKHDLHIWLVAHPTKLNKIGEGKNAKYPVPTPYDVSGSANWRNKAFNCIAVWRDDSDDSAPVQVHVQKIKFKKDGRRGMAKLTYDFYTGRYHDYREPRL